MKTKSKQTIRTAVLCFTLSTIWACSESQSDKVDAKQESQQVVVDIAANTAAQPVNTELLPYLQRPVTDDIFYFVMPDRFYNGSTLNDQGDASKPISFGGFDASNEKAYHGGDMLGLKAKLPYLKQLGITAIWMTPILRNQAVQGDVSGYHGYWVLDFTEIDPHLGSNDDLKALIDEAHALNIKVYFDIITNHTADVIKYQECHGNDGGGWSSDNNKCPYISLADKAAGKHYQPIFAPGTDNIKVPAWLNDPKYYHNQGDTSFEGENSVYGDFAGLDDIDTDNPEVVSKMITVFNDLISQFKPDGFRIDTVKHVNIEFWQQFSPAVIAHAKSIGIENFFMFGEVYSFDTAELSYYTTTGKLPSVLDFALQGALDQTLVKQQGTVRLAELFEQDSNYLDDDSSANELLTFTGNHDMGRFAYYLKKQHPMMSDSELVQRVNLAHAMLFFSRGIPVIYYGDEQGFTGDGGDSGSRQDMMMSKVAQYNDDILIGTSASTADDNFDTQHPIYVALQKLAAIYLNHPALRQGEQHTLYSQQTPGGFVLSRQLKGTDETYYVVFNTANSKQTVNLQIKDQAVEAIYAELNANQSGTTLSVNLPALSFAIYKQ